MKKLLSGITAFAAALFMTVNVIAATSSISIKNDAGDDVSYTYETDGTAETVTSIKSLMTELDGLSAQDSVLQTLTVTSESADNSPVEFKLRLSVAENADEDIAVEYAALDYYSIQITDTDGNIIYSDEEETDGAYKDIPLGILNKNSGEESRIFNIALSVNENADLSLKESAEILDWSIVSNAYIEPETETENSVEEIALTEENRENTEKTGTAYEDKYGVVTMSAGEYVCGEDIESGLYTMTGSGRVHIYTAEDALKATVALRAENDDSSNGVSEYVINLSDGERIVTEADVKFTPYTEPKATASPSPTKAEDNDSDTAASSSKTNPKTGDNVHTAVLSAAAVIALAAAFYIEIRKRKQH
ncbi:MAG: hypothetical protein LIO53_02320 [Oscillospiraceae bacterium]|nr:hypothetical protein [Oscillospiraceae bacterium]